MDISKNFDRGFKLVEWLFVLKDFLDLLDEELDHLIGEVNEGHRLGVLLPIVDDLIVEVVYKDVHDESDLVIHVLFSDVGDSFLELLAPLLLNVQGLALVLLRLQVLIEQSL